jgi:hypothetical protein
VIRYSEYIHSEKWRERRLAKLEQAHFRCEKCGEKHGLSVHHKTYDRLGNERADDLIVLCGSCHWVADEYRKGNVKLTDRFYTELHPKSKRQKLLEKNSHKTTSKERRKKRREIERRSK